MCAHSGSDASAFWLRTAPVGDVEARLVPLFVAQYGVWERSAGTAHAPAEWLRILVEGVRAEAHTLDEAVALGRFALADQAGGATPEARTALQGEHVGRVLARFADTLSAAALATPDTANAWLGELRHHFREGEGLRGREVMFPLRAALTGSMVGPCLGTVTSLLGVARCLERAQAARQGR